MTAMHVQPIEGFTDNYFWLLSDGALAWVVDPGDASVVEAALTAQRLQLKGILVTHHHADHVGGVVALAERHRVPVHGPAHEAIAGITEVHAEDEVFELGPFSVQVLQVPGHTRGHVAYYFAKSSWLFCGDTLFSAGCGRLFEGPAEQMLHSLARLATLPPQTSVYCAHEYTLRNLAFARTVEPQNAAIEAHIQLAQGLRAQGQPTVPTTLAAELAINPFLRCHEATVRAAVEAHAPGSGRTTLTAFTALRSWRNGFVGQLDLNA